MWSTGIGIILCLTPCVLSENNNSRSQFFQKYRSQKFYDVVEEISGPLDVPCTVPMCDGPQRMIYCHGPILSAASQFGLQYSCPGDKMKFTADVILKNFEKLGYPLKKSVFETFCNENFEQVAYLKRADLPDWVPNPEFLRNITNTRNRILAREVHDRWINLARQFTDDVLQNPDSYPLWPVHHPFIVPGGRFEVYFYWDSYWILKGLLLSDMTSTAEGIINNFGDLIDTHGFIPNSGNIQLSKRTQPPLFSQMVWDFTKHTGQYNEVWLNQMEQEMLFWERNRSISVEGKKMFLYNTITNCPRPENFMGDFNIGINQSDPSQVWKGISSACESGWDFSSRWMDQLDKSLESIHADSIIPVDLNVFLALNYQILADYNEYFQNYAKSVLYRKKFNNLVYAIQSTLWDEQKGLWFDYDLEKKQRNTNFYPSNVFPLLISSLTRYADRVASYVSQSEAFKYEGGVPSTVPVNSNQQWDFPNVWAPNQHLLIESFLATNNAVLKKEAEIQANKFITAVYNGLFNPTGKQGSIWEKYDARSSSGSPGSGGEYIVQEGFGWTNGAVLDLIWTFREGKFNLKQEEDSMFGTLFQKIVIILSWVLVGLILVWFLIRGIIYQRNRLNRRNEERGLLEADNANEV